MKRFLFSVVALVITSVCFAQDIIVQKDGSTIAAKITKVTQSEVEYKKFNNQNGPTYSISTKNLQCINYQNGTKDTFVSPNYNPNIVTNETATQFSNDRNLIALYNATGNYEEKGKKIRKKGYVIGGSLLAVGLILSALSVNSKEDLAVSKGGSGKKANNDEMLYIGLGTSAIGLGIGLGCHFWANRLYKQSQYEVSTFPILKNEIKIGKNAPLIVGVDILKDNKLKNQTLGLGVSYNF